MSTLLDLLWRDGKRWRDEQREQAAQDRDAEEEPEMTPAPEGIHVTNEHDTWIAYHGSWARRSQL